MAQTAARLFPLQDVLWFAEVSGDPNPVHIDPEVAARIYPGAVVAHGLHMVLWALEALPPEDTAILAEGLRVVFQKPVIVGEEVRAELIKPGSIGLTVAGQRTAVVRLKSNAAPERWARNAHPHAPSHPPVLKGPPEAEDEVVGSLSLPDNGAALAEAFPSLARRIGVRALRGLAAIAPVSGAVLGGVTTEVTVGFSDDDGADDFEYRFLSYHPAIQRFELAFWGFGVIGKVAAMAGPGGAHEG